MNESIQFVANWHLGDGEVGSLFDWSCAWGFTSTASVGDFLESLCSCFIDAE